MGVGGGSMTKRARRALAAAVLVASVTNALPGVTAAAEDTGPELSVAEADLAATLECPSAIEGADRDVIVLVPGTTVHPRTNFGTAWTPAFEALGYPYCWVVT